MADGTKKNAAAMLDQEHDELNVMISDLRSWLADIAELGVPHFGELSTRLRPLHEKLCEHFDHEEEHGLLSEAGDTPELSTAACELLKQHEQLRTELRDLINLLRDSETPFVSWQIACETFEGLCEVLAQHELAEMKVRGTAQDGGKITKN